MNKWVGIGRLTRDPELKFTNGTGTAVATFTLAVDRKFVDKATGQKEADFINIVAWRKTAEFAANYFKKGSLMGVSGSIQTSTYQAQDGSTRYKTEVVADDVEFVGGKKEPQENKQDTNIPEGYEPMDETDEDIPF